VKPGSNGSNGDVHDFGDFFVAELLHLSEDERGTQVRGKHAEKLFNDHLILNGAALVGLRFIELDELGSFQAQAVHAEPHTDPIDKSGKGAVVSELPDLAEGLQERFLRDIFRLMTISKKVRGRANQAVTVPRNQTSQSRLVTCTAAANPLSLLSRHFGGY
jgi:hypothetical protein